MTRIDIETEIYETHIIMVSVYDESDRERVRPLLEWVGAKDVDETLESIDGEPTGAVVTYSNHDRILVLFHPWVDDEDFFNVLNHEKRHVVDDILSFKGIEDKEAGAYLDGYLSRMIFQHLRELKGSDLIVK